MTTEELKDKYLKFFESKGHKVIPGSSLIPENDPTVLFISAGMHPLVPYLLGEKHPMGKRLVNVQKCIRTGDIDLVGDDVHLTYFEMLGNWSLGDYWKEDAIKWSYEFLTKELGLDNISVSCFSGDKDVPKDEESAKIWKSLGVSDIKFFGRKDNWWGPAGKTGPCGPDTEMFYNNVEIWNNVFMEYNKTGDGKYIPLEQKNVDTGMGVERTVAVLNGKKSVFDVEPLKSIVSKVKELGSVEDIKAERIIADHIRAACFILADGVVPSNLEQGYVLRRLIRRAIRYSRKIGINKPFVGEVAKIINDSVIEQLVQEEKKFSKTLEKGLRELKRLVEKKKKEESPYLKADRPDFGSKSDDWSNYISGKEAFNLYQTYGFPPEQIREELANYGMSYHKGEFQKEFKKEFKKHQELSKTTDKFKSGLADHSEEVTRLHTATHLLLVALRQVLGNHVFQKGSNITGERLRFDFSHSEKLTEDQLKKVESIVNGQIKKDLPVSCCEVSLEEAKKMSAMGVFEYEGKVKVYTIGDSKKPFSCEICGGPHVESTGKLGHLKILKEESSSAGIRRIRAVLE